MKRVVFLLLLVVLMASSENASAWTFFSKQTASAPSASPTSPAVEIFVTSWCPYCRKLENFLKQSGIPYTRYDVEKDPKGAAIFKSIGGEGVPVSRIGSSIVRGYDPEGILTALHHES